MTSKGKRELVYEGYTLPKLTIKELLARNARKDCELKFIQKQLDKAKEELESDFSRTRSSLLSRVHNLLLEGQTYDLGDDQSSSDEEQLSTFESSAANYDSVNDSSAPWETSLKNLSSSQFEEDTYTRGLNRNLRHNQPWAEKVEHFEHSLAVKAEPVSSKPSPRRKISWGGRANVLPENWDARSVLSKSSSEGNLSSKAACPFDDDSRLRVRRHTVVGRSKSFNPKSSGITNETLQNHKSSNTKRQAKQRRHTVCTRENFQSRLTPTEEEKCPVKKPLSELLPPIKLPPIYLQESKGKEPGKKSDKNLVNAHVQIDVRKPLDAQRLTEDLRYCRYLRVNRKDDSNYT